MDPEMEIEKYLQSKGVQRAVLKDMLDDFAHNLAKAIRENCEKVTCGPTQAQCACTDQADLIDPKVTR